MNIREEIKFFIIIIEAKKSKDINFISIDLFVTWHTKDLALDW